MAPRRAPSPASPSSAIASAFTAARRGWDRSERRLRAPDGATLGGIPRVRAVRRGRPRRPRRGDGAVSPRVRRGRPRLHLRRGRRRAPPLPCTSPRRRPGRARPALRRARNRFGAPFGSSASPDDDERAGSSAPGPHSEDAPRVGVRRPAPAVVLHPGGAGGVALDTSHAAFDGVFDARTAAVADLALDAWDVQCARRCASTTAPAPSPGPSSAFVAAARVRDDGARVLLRGLAHGRARGGARVF